MNKLVTTTEFYRKPYKYLEMAREKGPVEVGYKNLNQPVAVLVDYETFVNMQNSNQFAKKKPAKNNAAALLLELAQNAKPLNDKHYKSGLDFQNKVRD